MKFKNSLKSPLNEAKTFWHVSEVLGENDWNLDACFNDLMNDIFYINQKSLSFQERRGGYIQIRTELWFLIWLRGWWLGKLSFIMVLNAFLKSLTISKATGFVTNHSMISLFLVRLIEKVVVGICLFKNEISTKWKD